MKRNFIICFCCGFGAVIVFMLWLTYWYIPRLNTEGWLKNVLWCKLYVASKTPSPKIIILSGSNAFWGMDSAVIEKRCGYPVVNLAFHASFPVNSYKDLLDKVLNEGDIVILPLELTHYEQSVAINPIIMEACLGWGKEFFPNLTHPLEIMFFYTFPAAWRKNFFRKIPRNIRKFKKNSYLSKAEVLNVFQRHSSTHNISATEKPMFWQVYSFRNMNQYGDIVRTQNLEKLVVRQISFQTKPSDFFLRSIQELEQFAHSRNARIALTWPVLCKDAFNSQQLAALQKSCQKSGITIYGNIQDFQFSTQCFSDTHYHLKTQYARKRTEILVDCMIENNLLPKVSKP